MGGGAPTGFQFCNTELREEGVGAVFNDGLWSLL